MAKEILIGRIVKSSMREQKSDEEALIQNLKDAGCDEQTIAKFMDCLREDMTGEMNCILKCHRACILDELHTQQEKLDCLDYLIHKMKAEKNNM